MRDQRNPTTLCQGCIPTDYVDVAKIVKEQNTLLQPDGPRIPGDDRYSGRPTKATPRAMKMLLDLLSAQTEKTRVAWQQNGTVVELGGAQQWEHDMANWQARLDHYYDKLSDVPPEEADTVKGADRIYFTVTAPLLDGVFYELMLPGISYSDEESARMTTQPSPWNFSNKKVPDVIMPFTLANQVAVFREHQKMMWEQLWKDFGASIRDLFKKPAQAAEELFITAAVTVAGGLLGAGLMYYGVIRPRERAMAAARGAYLPSGAG